MTKFLINIPNVNEINHVVVFLTGAQGFPEGYGGQIYLAIPDPTTGEIGWNLLGHVTNLKPSAIFKISNLKKSDQLNAVSSSFFGQPAAMMSNNPLLAQIGISIESLHAIEQSTPVSASTVSTVSTFIEFSNKMLENFMNYITSFSTGSMNGEYVPISAVKTWYENFQRRMQANPYFWRI